jgi:hypothetical protein
MDNQMLYLAHLIGFKGGEKGPPVLKNVVGIDKAAGVEIADLVPTGKLWRLLSWSVTLAQGATQTPTPNLILKDDATSPNEVLSFPLTSAAVSVSTTTRLMAATGLTLTAGAGATRNYAPIPSGLLVPAGWTIGTVTTGIGANTDYGPASIFVAEYSV